MVMPEADMINKDLNFLYFVVRRIKAMERIPTYQEAVLAYKTHDPIWESTVNQAIDHYDYIKDSGLRKQLLSSL